MKSRPKGRRNISGLSSLEPQMPIAGRQAKVLGKTYTDSGQISISHVGLRAAILIHANKRRVNYDPLQEDGIYAEKPFRAVVCSVPLIIYVVGVPVADSPVGFGLGEVRQVGGPVIRDRCVEQADACREGWAYEVRRFRGIRRQDHSQPIAP